MVEGVARLIRGMRERSSVPGTRPSIRRRRIRTSPPGRCIPRRDALLIQDQYGPVKITNQLMSGQVSVQKLGQRPHVVGRGRFEPHRLPGSRVRKTQAGGVQGLAGEVEKGMPERLW